MGALKDNPKDTSRGTPVIAVLGHPTATIKTPADVKPANAATDQAEARKRLRAERVRARRRLAARRARLARQALAAQQALDPFAQALLQQQQAAQAAQAAEAARAAQAAFSRRKRVR